MGYTLFDLTYRVARELGIIVEGTPTAGAVGSITDTVGLQNIFVDDYFIRGGCWLLYDAGGAGAAPQGEYVRISDFVKTTGVVSFATNFSVAPAAGDRYALSVPTYTLDQLVSFINGALGDTPIKVTDYATITTAADKTEYPLPVALLEEDSLEVWIQTYTSDTNDNRWVRWHEWYIQETATGSAKLLVFRSQPAYTYAIKLVYWIPHPPLYTMSAKLREQVDINRVVLDAAARAARWKRDQHGDTDPALETRIKTLEGRAVDAKWKSPAAKDKVKLASLGSTEIGIEMEDS